MTSGSNSVIHQNRELLAISKNVNSKKHFAENAPRFGIPTPETLITSKQELNSQKVNNFFLKHDNKIMIKLMGLAGARNVAAISSVEEAQDYVEEYDNSMIILLKKNSI